MVASQHANLCFTPSLLRLPASPGNGSIDSESGHRRPRASLSLQSVRRLLEQRSLRASQMVRDGRLGERERERDVQTEAAFGKQLTTSLTERQREAARTAYFAGFFESPREHSGEEVASMLDISQTTFTQHLRAAEKKLFAALIDGTGAN